MKLNKTIMGLIGITLAVFVFSMINRAISSDEAWLFEYSYWLQKVGYVKSEFMRGFMNSDTKLFIYHKLFQIQGALLIKWFGISPYALKLSSLFYLLLSLALLWKILEEYSISLSGKLLFLSLFLSTFHIMQFGFEFRPEMLVMLIGLATFFTLDLYFRARHPAFLYLSALLSGMAVAAHLNGTIFVGAGVLLLWSQRKWLPGVIYGLIGSWGLIFFILYDVRSANELHLLFAQLLNWRDVATSNYHWSQYLFRLLNEQQRFLHSPPEMAYTFLLLGTIIPMRNLLWNKYRVLFLYPIILTGLLALISHGKTPKYLVYAQPYFLILATLAIQQSLLMHRKTWKYSLPVGVFLLSSWVMEIRYFKEKESLRDEYALIASLIPQNASVLAPSNYIYEAIEKHRIQGIVVPRDNLEKEPDGLNPFRLFEEAKKYQNDFVIVDETEQKIFKMKAEDYGEYRLVSQPSKRLLLYQKIKN